jgi:hypothetical protein
LVNSWGFIVEEFKESRARVSGKYGVGFKKLGVRDTERVLRRQVPKEPRILIIKSCSEKKGAHDAVKNRFLK